MQHSVARQFAMTILFVIMIGSGLSLAILLTGNRELSLQVCGIFVVVGVLILVVGAFFVGRSRAD
jgi:hypothetical protein